MAKLIVWLTICAIVALVTFMRGPGDVPADAVRSSIIGVIFGSVAYFVLAIASLPFTGE